jgi:hypothetical protein
LVNGFHFAVHISRPLSSVLVESILHRLYATAATAVLNENDKGESINNYFFCLALCVAVTEIIILGGAGTGGGDNPV